MAATVHFPVRRFHGLPCHGVTVLTGPKMAATGALPHAPFPWSSVSRSDRADSQRKDQPETGLHIGKVVRRQPAGTLYEPSLIEAACLRHDKD